MGARKDFWNVVNVRVKEWIKIIVPTKWGCALRPSTSQEWFWKIFYTFGTSLDRVVSHHKAFAYTEQHSTAYQGNIFRPKLKTKLCCFSPQANYTNRTTAACRQIYC
jgi:hypothetical protein